MRTDAENAAAYWSGREFKKFAVDVTAGPSKKLTYISIFYCRARTADAAIASVKREASGIPSRAIFKARLAGPHELGCIPIGVSK